MKHRNLLFSGKYATLLLDYLRPQQGRVVWLALLLLGGIVLQLVNPQIVRVFLDTAESRSGLQRLFGAAALFMSLAIVRQGIQLLTTYMGENVAWTATNLLRADLALHCLKLDMSFHKQYKAGELIERVDGDVNQLANFFSQLVVRLGSNLLLVVGILLLFWWQDWRIGLSISLVALIGALALKWLNQRTIPRWQALREADAQLFGSLEEWLNGTEEIRTNGAEPYVMRRLYESLRERWQRILAAMRIQVLISDLPSGTFALAYCAAHILGSSIFREGGMSIGEVYLVFYYLDVMKDPLWEIVRQVEDLQRASASINRIRELRDLQPTILDGPGVVFPEGPLAVSFDQVDFHYEDDRETRILHQISFDLRPGAVLGVLGRTGSGKSTLTKLLYRFHDPTYGRICVGNGQEQSFDIRQAWQTELRQHIGMVTQDVQLFRATVRHNLTLFDEEIRDERIWEVIRDVGLDDWLAELPGGLDTPLEAGGQGLSAGQAQLLALARVFLADPGLIILDEASSRLDPVTEQLIEKAVDKLLSNRTAIIVAHRLTTVQRASEIMILSDGRIVEHGLRLELAGNPDSHYSRLLRTDLEEALA
jgi:ATP-binding cassette subfamily B protein